MTGWNKRSTVHVGALAVNDYRFGLCLMANFPMSNGVAPNVTTLLTFGIRPLDRFCRFLGHIG